MQSLLQNVEFTVQAIGSELSVTAPFWRTDIEIAEDIVEEIGRLYGFDKLPLVLPTRSLQPTKKDPTYQLKQSIREFLCHAGASEVLTYNFVHGKLIEQVGQEVSDAYRLSNALSPELQYFRLSLTPSLLEKVYSNIKAGYEEFALFELNKVHDKRTQAAEEPDLPAEHERLGFVYATQKSSDTAAYYVTKYYVDALAAQLGIELAYQSVTDAQQTNLLAPFEPVRTAHIYIKDTGSFLGVVGEYRRSVARALKLPNACSGFEINIIELLKHGSGKSTYRKLPRFPKVMQDITLKVPATVTYQSLYDGLQLALADLEPQNAHASVYPLDIYQKPTETDLHVTFRYTLASYERTLSATEVNALLDKVATALAQQFEVVRV